MNEKGKRGEQLAATYLRQKGYTILERNYSGPYGEIDLIAQKDSFLVFVEVKERKSGSLVDPLEAVTKSKQKKLWLTAQQYLQECSPESLQPRFDVIAVYKQSAENTLVHIENAFQGDE